MTERTTIEATLKPYRQELEHLVRFITSKEGARLTRSAATAAYDYHTNRNDGEFARKIRAGVTALLNNRRGLLRNNEIDFSRLTPEVISGLWEVCALTSNPGAFYDLSEFKTKLQAPQHNFFALLAAALDTLRES